MPYRTVDEVVQQQADVGIDVVSDGEFGKAISWSQYALERLSGFERRPVALGGANPFARGADRAEFARNSTPSSMRKNSPATMSESVCVGPIKYTGQASSSATSITSRRRWPR